LNAQIDINQLPTRFHSLEALKVWHVRRVILDSITYPEAARRLGVSTKTLWEIRRRYKITEMPGP